MRSHYYFSWSLPLRSSLPCPAIPSIRHSPLPDATPSSLGGVKESQHRTHTPVTGLRIKAKLVENVTHMLSNGGT